ncbi:MAG: TRZ/ATZ family hydrolase [Gammaproteobacteria bacterium]|nr:TRZ/ATZ family hydrolase [Gammaproteobacteria bacterium]
MRSIQTLLSAGTVIPVDPQDSILIDHSIAIDQGRIVDLLPTTEALEQYQANQHIEYNEHILMPGLINGHSHAAMSLLKGLGSDLPLQRWLNESIWPTESRWVDAQFVHDGSELAIAEMLRGGITCFNDMYFFPEATARAASAIGMRSVVGMIIIEFPSAYASTVDEYFAKGLDLFDQYKTDPLVNVVFAPHAPYTVSDDSLKKLNSYANELDLAVHMHIHETASEIEDSIKEHGKRPIARLQELGLINPNLLAVHMTQLTAEEISLVAEAGVTVVHCPESNLKLASGFCPVNELLKNGCSVILGTDGSASNDDLDLFSEMRTAALLAKGVSGDAAAFNARLAVRAATLDAATALGLGDEIGSLEKGKAADIIAIDCSSLEAQPIYDAYSHLLYAVDRAQVEDVFVAGRQLLRKRSLTTVSEDEIITKTHSWRQRIQP